MTVSKPYDLNVLHPRIYKCGQRFNPWYSAKFTLFAPIPTGLARLVSDKTKACFSLFFIGFANELKN